jgi:hypothetical protein
MTIKEVGMQMQERKILKGVEPYGDQNLANGEV